MSAQPPSAARSLILLLLVQLAGLSLPTPLRPNKEPDYVLNEFIRYYEPVIYDSQEVLKNHHRIKRSSSHAHPLRIHFATNHRDFRISLYPDRGVFSDDVTFETGTGKRLDFDTGNAYQGTLEDDDGAVVRGVITCEGLFDGIIETASEDFYVEPVSRYRRETTGRVKEEGGGGRRRGRLEGIGRGPPLGFHSVVYKGTDVRGLPGGGRWGMDAILGPPSPLQTQPFTPLPPQANKTTCMLYLQADHLFYQKYSTEEACIEVMTRHVQRVNSIYKTTDFNQDGRPDNISFMIKRIKVHTSDSLNDPVYRFPGNYGVEKFLELFSEEDYDAFCLAYMFTYRDFEMGTLGLAWTGDLKNAGGVCEKNGHYRGSMKSLNTGIVTLLNYGKHVPPAVSHVTLAHEIGHNFGSPHDPEVCTPGGEDGNFIMFARATSGDKKNNNRFSPCSLNSINPVLNTKARSIKGCFTEPQSGICGNGVVEEGEQCDCGWEEDCRDDCCYPQRRSPPPDQPPCHLTPHSVCSPSQGPCCTPECRLKFGDKCRDDNGCRDSSFCDGRGPHCPPSINKPNKTICNDEFVCFMGECTGSICLAYGLESCQCIPGPVDPATKACELCCKIPGESQPCLSSFYWNNTSYEMPMLYSKPGTPCNDYNGYCDVFQKCREVDPSGPLATLRKLLLSEQSIASFKRWVMDRWYYALLILASLILILVLSTRLLGKRTELKLKGITIIHSSATADALRGLGNGEENSGGTGGGGNVVVHPAVSSKLPLRRRVRRGGRGEGEGGKKGAEGKKGGGEGKKKKRGRGVNNGRKGGALIERGGKDGGATVAVRSAEEDPLGKVRQWLLSSDVQRRTAGVVRKSKSSPAGFLTSNTSQVPATPTTPAAGNITSVSQSQRKSTPKANLQVVYKPPFKFSVRLRKPAQVATTVVKEINSKVRKPANNAGGGRRAAILTSKNHIGKDSNPSNKQAQDGNGGKRSGGRLNKGVEGSGVVDGGGIKSGSAPLTTPTQAPPPPTSPPPPPPNQETQSPPLLSLLQPINRPPSPRGEHVYENLKHGDSVPPDTEVLLSESEYLFSES